MVDAIVDALTKQGTDSNRVSQGDIMTKRTKELQNVIDNVATKAFGETSGATTAKKCCISCKQPIKEHPSIMAAVSGFPSVPATIAERQTKGMIYSAAGLREYKMSGMCEACFDASTSDDDDWSEDEGDYDDCPF